MTDVFIVPLNLGTKRSDKSVSIMGHEPEVYTGVIVAYYIKDGETNILVDTGYSIDQNFLEKYFPETLAFKRGKEQELPNALKSIGLRPKDIDIVINTHLHFDHCTNNNLFENVEAIVQRKEIQYAIAPEYSSDCIDAFRSVDQLKIPGPRPPLRDPYGLIPMLQEGIPVNLKLVDGNKEITDNVSVVHTPGHTPGLQSVVVKTNKGTVVIPSDNVPLFENWRLKRAGARYSAPYSKERYLHLTRESFEKIGEIADFILPSHDINVFEKEKYP